MNAMRSSLALMVLAATLAIATAAPFNPVTFNWGKIFTAYPQPVSSTNTQELVAGPNACLAPYALCAYANCTIVEGSKPLVAACGCVGFNRTGASGGTAAYMLDAQLKAQDLAACGPGKNATCLKRPNTAAFCKAMQHDRNGKASMYGGTFDVISTYNPRTWPTNTKPNQGSKGDPQKCTKGGYVALCYSAPCMLQKAWNGMNTTCYCPVYDTTKTGAQVILASNAPGFSCSGQKGLDGRIKYVQNGA